VRRKQVCFEAATRSYLAVTQQMLSSEVKCTCFGFAAIVTWLSMMLALKALSPDREQQNLRRGETTNVLPEN
jgi:hypothetical protein